METSGKMTMSAWFLAAASIIRIHSCVVLFASYLLRERLVRHGMRQRGGLEPCRRRMLRDPRRGHKMDEEKSV